MIIQKRIRNTINWIKSWDLETLKSARMGLFFLIVGDLFGLYWYLRLESLGMLIMVVCVVGLAIVLMVERLKLNELEKNQKELKGGKKQMEEETKQMEEETKQEPKEEKEDTGFGLGIDLGLPNSEEYNKRMKKALGSGF
ncbi:MAG TPA: hypothetical protein VMZ91_11565 [Candidatus Paceibacterota bacterium]|nr:hypothetical protein [Candidatus Paceibacterota bacterium]